MLIALVLGLLVSSQNAGAQGIIRVSPDKYYTVQDTDLREAPFTFDEFKDAFSNEYFICVDSANPFSQSFDAVFQLTDIAGNRVTLTEVINEMGELDPNETIQIRRNNFAQFRRAFVSLRALHFSNRLPVKFYKVKTATTVDDIEFYNSPGGNVLNATPAEKGLLFYYAYKNRVVDGQKYVLLGKAPKSVQNYQDLQDIIIGWVRYEERLPQQSTALRQNVVLWNTNIGLRPVDGRQIAINRQPYVFFKDEGGLKRSLDYYRSGAFKQDSLLVDDQALLNFHTRYQQKEEKINRWLPMYIVPQVPANALLVGVIEKVGQIRRDLANLLTTKKLRLALLVDASLSMRQVWENLDDVLVNVLEEMTRTQLTNISGENIEIAVKIFSFSESVRLVNKNRWIASPNDVAYYRASIESIPLEPTLLYPDIYQAMAAVINEVGGESIFMVVIGDAGDNRVEGAFGAISEVQALARDELFVLYGIRFDSRFWYNSPYIQDPLMKSTMNNEINQASYYDAHKRFSNNFPLLHDINSSVIKQPDVDRMAGNLTRSITGEMSKLIRVGSGLLTSGDEGGAGVQDLSVFSQLYLESIRSELSKMSGSGSFFEEGLVNVKDKNNIPLYHKDLLIEEEKIASLIEGLQRYHNQKSRAGFKRLLRDVIATFFEIDFQQVDENFLEQTTLSSFWTRIVGDRVVAKRLMPKLFDTDKNFQQISNDWGKYKANFSANSVFIKDQLNKHIQNRVGYYPVLVNAQKGIIKEYYWVDVESIQFFRGIY